MWKETPQRPQPQTMTHRHLQPSRLHSHWLHPHTCPPCNCTRVRRYGCYIQCYKPLLTNITVFIVDLSMMLYTSTFFTDHFQAMLTTALYFHLTTHFKYWTHLRFCSAFTSWVFCSGVMRAYTVPLIRICNRNNEHCQFPENPFEKYGAHITSLKLEWINTRKT